MSNHILRYTYIVLLTSIQHLNPIVSCTLIHDVYSTILDDGCANQKSPTKRIREQLYLSVYKVTRFGCWGSGLVCGTNECYRTHREGGSREWESERRRQRA